MEGDYLLESEEAREERKRMLHLPHILPLVDYLDSVKEALGSDVKCPMFDPCDGGINAKALFLQQDPGEKAVKSGFISRNNPDQTARNTNHLLHDAGFRRKDTILWNIVPWYVGTGKIKDSDIERAMPFLEQLLSLIEDLKVIVLVGKKAQGAFSYLSRIAELPVLCSYHPSPLWINSDPNPPARYLDILVKFQEAKNILSGDQRRERPSRRIQLTAEGISAEPSLGAARRTAMSTGKHCSRTPWKTGKPSGWQGDLFFNTNETHAPGAYRKMFGQGVIAIYGYPNGPYNLTGSTEGQRIFAYVNRKGILAVGHIVDSQPVPGSTVFDEEGEFHVRVAWETTVADDKGVTKQDVRQKYGRDIPVRKVFCRLLHSDIADWIAEELQRRCGSM